METHTTDERAARMHGFLDALRMTIDLAGDAPLTALGKTFGFGAGTVADLAKRGVIEKTETGMKWTGGTVDEAVARMTTQPDQRDAAQRLDDVRAAIKAEVEAFVRDLMRQIATEIVQKHVRGLETAVLDLGIQVEAIEGRVKRIEAEPKPIPPASIADVVGDRAAGVRASSANGGTVEIRAAVPVRVPSTPPPVPVKKPRKVVIVVAGMHARDRKYIESGKPSHVEIVWVEQDVGCGKHVIPPKGDFAIYTEHAAPFASAINAAYPGRASFARPSVTAVREMIRLIAARPEFVSAT